MATLKELENLAYTEYINKDYAYMIGIRFSHHFQLKDRLKLIIKRIKELTPYFTLKR